MSETDVPVEDISDLREAAAQLDENGNVVEEGALDVDPPEAVDKRGRGGLEADVKAVTDDFYADNWYPTNRAGERANLTSHMIAKRIQEVDGLEKRPSTGAIQNVLTRWETLGFAVVSRDPKLHFVEYTQAAHEVGLEGLRQQVRDERKAERAAAKAVTAASDAEGNEKPKRKRTKKTKDADAS